MGYKNKPPSWSPNAIPTKRGWVDPKTGELLISIKGLEIPEVPISEVPAEVQILEISVSTTMKNIELGTVVADKQTVRTPVKRGRKSYKNK